MSPNRREIMKSGLGVAAGLLMTRMSMAAGQARQVRAVAFDAFPVFDPRPIAMLAEEQFPGKGTEVINTWRTRQFEYTWLRSLAGRYADFMQVTEDSLVFTAKMLKLELSDEKRQQLINSYFALKAWPDVAPGLTKLKEQGLRLAFLSNFTPAMLEGCIKAAGLQGVFDAVLSTDAVRTYKPDPRAYQLGVDRLGLRREEILFVAFAGWDAAGAKSFGYPTFWVNCLGLPAEELGALPDAQGANLNDLVAYLQV